MSRPLLRPCLACGLHDARIREQVLSVERIAEALEVIWRYGWIQMPDHETEQIAAALRDALGLP